MRFKYVFVCLILINGIILFGQDKNNELKNKSDFIQLDPISYELKKGSKTPVEFTTNKTRIWYSFFKADNSPETKPLFVFLNGGPGCATSLVLFAMNTAPYTLCRDFTGGKIYAKNKYSWTKLGNLLYIDAPNTGFSYGMVKKGYRHEIINSFINGSNYNPFIDADQILRVVLKIMEQNPQIRKNKVVFVGESYSGVRISTILNLILFNKDYRNSRKVFRDKELCDILQGHFDKVFEKKDIHVPEEIAKQFSGQILIQPQIVDVYQNEDKAEIFKTPGSIMHKLKINSNEPQIYDWKSYMHNPVFKGDICAAAMVYLKLLNRDQYNYRKNWDWSDDTETEAMKALDNIEILSKFTDTDVNSIEFMKPKNRKNAVRYMFGKSETNFLHHNIVKKLLDNYAPHIKIMMEFIPHQLMEMTDKKEKNSLELKLGALNKYDSYVVGTNAYVFIGFMVNSGYKHMFRDEYGISPAASNIYGKLFLENLTLVDTFMTDAELDLVIYSSTIATQFDSKKGRFPKIVSSLDIKKGNTDTDGSFTIFYKPGSINGIKNVPKSRTVYWPYYGESGHSVSFTQPEKFLRDVENWLKKASGL